MHIKYRPEIDGLRAIAVLAVIFYHAKFCASGFLGVDVFFIISGYLITAILLNDLKNNTFTFADFYEHRARRILPMLLIMTLATIPFAWYFLSDFQLYMYAQSILAVELFVSNIWFALSTSYFAPSNDLVPLIHTWSLGVEEQFYILWPLVLSLIWRFCRKYLLILIIFLVISSLLLAQYLSVTNRIYNFFLLPPRIWEIMSGAILAYIESTSTTEKNTKLKALIPPICLTILIVHFAFIPIANNPNINTCIPALATLGLIYFGGKNDVATKILSNKYFVAVGLMSYSAYLWHQPILVFLNYYNLGRLLIYQKVLYIPATLVLSYFSWKYIEVPMRDKQKIGLRKFSAACLLLMLILTVCAILIIFYKGFPDRSNIPRNVRNTIVYSKLESNYTKIGDLERKKIDFLVYGDSHTIAIYPAIKKAAKENHKLGVISSVRGCAAILGNDLKARSNEKICMQRNSEVINYVREHNIHNVILVGKWLRIYERNKQDLSTFNTELHKTLNAYKDLKVNVYIFLQVPPQLYDIYTIYNVAYKQELDKIALFIDEHSVSSNTVLSSQQEFIDYLQPNLLNNTKVINPDLSLCDQQICPIGTLRTSYYADFNHLSPHGAMRLLPLFKDLLGDMN